MNALLDFVEHYVFPSLFLSLSLAFSRFLSRSVLQRAFREQYFVKKENKIIISQDKDAKMIYEMRGGGSFYR